MPLPNSYTFTLPSLCLYPTLTPLPYPPYASTQPLYLYPTLLMPLPYPSDAFTLLLHLYPTIQMPLQDIAEINQHLHMCEVRQETFQGRDEIVEKLKRYVQDKNVSDP